MKRKVTPAMVEDYTHIRKRMIRQWELECPNCLEWIWVNKGARTWACPHCGTMDSLDG